MSDATSDRDPFEVVAESFLARYRAGERPSIEDLAVRHPELAGPIRKLLPALVRVERDLSVAPDRGPGSKGERSPLVPVPGKERRLGDYRILREIGRGGMGVVYEAEQISLGRRVALKVLPAHVACDRAALERFRREAKAAARLHHTNIVPVFEVGRDGEVAYYAMQFIQGQGLDQVIDELARLRGLERKPEETDGPRAEAAGTLPGLRRRKLGRIAESVLSGRFSSEGAVPARAMSPDAATGPPATEPMAHHPIPSADFALKDSEPARPAPAAAPELSAVLPGGTQVSTVPLSGRRVPFFRSVAQIGRQAAQGLAYAHARGIVHRDIKPSNLLLDHAGVVWIADFGLAKGEDEGLTESGDILGTLRYMAPERFRGQGDARADIYALGLTLYELLTFRSAFDSADRLRLIEQINTEEPRKPRSVDARIPRDLETIVLKAIEKDPRARYPSAEAMGEDLRRFLADEPIKARQVSTSERYWRWARRNPTIAVLGAVLTAMLVLVTIGSLLAAGRFAGMAERARNLADAERWARQEAFRNAVKAETEARSARKAEQQARNLATAEAAAKALAQEETQRAQKARTEADQNRNLLRVERDQGRQKLYFAEMTLAGIAAEAPAGLGRVEELLARWGPAAPGAGPDLRGWEWYYLDSLARQAALTLRGHVGAVRAVAYTRDGKRLATGGDDQTVRIWDTASGRELACLRGHTGALLGVAWSPDGARLATASRDGTARIWDVVSGAELGQLGSPGPPVTAVAWRPDGARVATTGHDFHVRVWDADTGREVFGRRLGSTWRMAVAWSPDGKKLASGAWDHVATVLDGETGAVLASLRGHNDGVLGVSWSPSGDRLATASWDRTVRIWDPGTGEESAVLSGAGYYLYAVCWSPDGKQIAAGGGNRAVQIWDTDTRRARTVLRGNQSDVWALAWSPDGPSLAATSEEGVTRLWDVRPGSALGPGQVRPRWPEANISPDGTEIAVVRENDPLVSILDPVSGNLLRTLGGAPPGRLWKVRWSPDGTRVACTAWGWALVVWDVRTGERVIPAAGDGSSRHFALAWSPAGDRVATGDDRGRICVWDSSSGRKLLEIPCKAEVWDLSWSPDGRQIASARWDGMASVWDAATGSEVLTLRGHSGRVVAVGWSPDGKRIATGSYDCTVKLWDPATGQETLTLRGHASSLAEVHWHADGGRLTTRDGQGNVLIWDATPTFLAERSATSLRALAGRIERDPADTTARRLRAEVLARRGDWDAAALDFSELARLPVSAAAVYPAGWWALAGPEDRPPAFAALAGAAPARWLAPADDPNGFVALPADGTTAVGRVFAPRGKVVALDIDPAPPARLWLNEKAIGAAARGPILVELREGWNALALGGRPGELYVRWRDFDKPADNAERLILAQVAFDHKQFTAATRLWAEALEIDPKLGGNRRAQYRYKAARAAVLAAAGHDTNEPPLDDAAKAKLRRQALEWLKAELAAWSKGLEPGSRASRPAIARALSDWEQNPDLAGVRDSAALARIPEADRKEWQALWAGFRDLVAAAIFPDDLFAPAVSLPKPDGGSRALTAGEMVEEVRKGRGPLERREAR